MEKIIIILFITMSALHFTASANEHQTGMLNVSLGKSPIEESPVQEATLYGCNNTIVSTELFWDTDNQNVGDIPFGNHGSDSDKPYYISKYYIASPPVFRKNLKPLRNNKKHASDKKPPFIGLVTPDSFTLTGDKPAKIVYLDYRILKPTYLKNVPVDYHHQNENGKSCADLGVDVIAVNMQCRDFPWRNGSFGASGIAGITQKSNDVFVPFAGDGQTPLQCEVTVLDDIQLNHEIFFALGANTKSKTVSSTEHFKNGQAPIKLICLKRPVNEVPSGCAPQEAVVFANQ